MKIKIKKFMLKNGLIILLNMDLDTIYQMVVQEFFSMITLKLYLILKMNTLNT